MRDAAVNLAVAGLFRMAPLLLVSTTVPLGALSVPAERSPTDLMAMSPAPVRRPAVLRLVPALRLNPAPAVVSVSVGVVKVIAPAVAVKASVPPFCKRLTVPRLARKTMSPAVAVMLMLLFAPMACNAPVDRLPADAEITLRKPVPLDTGLRLRTACDLDLVDLEVTLPQAHGDPNSVAPGDLGLDVLYGGVVTVRVMKSSSRVGFDLRPPRPLRHDDRHDYAFRITMPPERPMAPYYVCTPRFPCDLFRLIVRFGPDRVPASVWRLDAVPCRIET